MAGKHSEDIFILRAFKIPEETIKPFGSHSPVFASVNRKSCKVLGPVTLRGGLGKYTLSVCNGFHLKQIKNGFSLFTSMFIFILLLLCGVQYCTQVKERHWKK